MPNPIAYVEIPVLDLARAAGFYAEVFEMRLEQAIVDGYEMALFPFEPDGPGCAGALAKGDVYTPAPAGPIVYMRVPSIAPVLERASRRGAPVLLDRKPVGGLGFVAEIGDSEGNRIGLFEPAEP